MHFRVCLQVNLWGKTNSKATAWLRRLQLSLCWSSWSSSFLLLASVGLLEFCSRPETFGAHPDIWAEFTFRIQGFSSIGFPFPRVSLLPSSYEIPLKMLILILETAWVSVWFGSALRQDAVKTGKRSSFLFLASTLFQFLPFSTTTLCLYIVDF